MEVNECFKKADMSKAVAIIVKLYEKKYGIKIEYELVRKDEIA